MTDFNQVVNRYGTYSTQWDYVQDRFGEKNLLPFSISDMDFKVPEGTQKVLTQAVSRGLFGYTRWNHTTFKGAITQWFQTQFHCALEEEWVVYSPSVIYSVSVLSQLLQHTTKKIVTFTPCYDAFFHTIAENHLELLHAALKKSHGQFVIDFAALEALFQTEHPSLFLLCNPHNPTGRAFSLEELTQLIDLCNMYHVGIISDEIHMDVRRKGVNHHPILSLINQIKVPVVLLSSASKTFNTPGLGCSYAIIPDEKLREKFLCVLKGRDGLSSIPYLGMLALIDCYTKEQQWLNELNAYIDGNFAVVRKMLHAQSALDFDIPEATYLGWIELKKMSLTMDQLQTLLVHREKVAIMRGDTYGKEGTNYLRLNLGAPRSKIEAGVNALLNCVD